MRSQEIMILNKKYLMVFSNRVLAYMEKKNIKLDELTADGAPVTTMAEMIQQMIVSGAKYSKMTGGPEYPEISLEDLLEFTGVEELKALLDAAVFCMSGKRNIDAEVPPKNGDATQEGQDQRT